MSSKLEAFLNNYRVYDNNWNLTRMSGGKYNVPEDKYSKLLKYVSTETSNFDLLEKHPETHSKLCMDLDFQYNKKEKREITQSLVKLIIKEINNTIIKYTEKYDPDDIQAFVFIRPEGYLSDKGVYKDGLHIMYPYIEIDYAVQYGMFEEYTNELLNTDIFKGLKVNLNNLFDKSVIKSNNWFMYGCSKSKIPPYELWKVFDIQTNEVENTLSDLQLTALLSLNYNRGKYLKASDNFKPVEKKKTCYKRLTILTEKDKIKYAKLLELLPSKYCDNYDEWFNVGVALYNTHPDLYEVFDEWSKNSEKYGNTEEYWNKFSKSTKNEKRTLGSIIYEARKENVEKFYEWDELYNDKKMHEKDNVKKTAIIDNTHYDFAKWLYLETENSFAYSDGKWYEYKENHWTQIKDTENIILRKILNVFLEELEKEYMRYKILCTSENNENNEKEENKLSTFVDINEKHDEFMMKNYEKILKNKISLKTAGFKSGVLTESKMFFYNDNFVELLDMNKYLIGFKNGVYDLEKDEFREGMPLDYISYSTGYDYTPNINHTVRKEIMEKLLQIQPDKDILDFILTILSSTLEGENNNEIFPCLEGSGGNGKSFISDLHSASLGDYAGVLNNTYLVNQFNAPEHHNTMIYNNYKKRYIQVNEPPKNKELNINFIKELTGGDKIQLRPAHSTATYTVQPQFKLFCLFNKMPKIEDTADGGFLRRFIGIKFPNKFVDNPTKPNEFKKDTTLKIKIKNNPEWHQQWMLLMLEYYRIYKQNNRNIVIPKKVKDNTQKLVNNQDIVKDYITTTLIISDDKDEYMSLTELYNSYVSFHTSATKDTKPLSKKDFMERLLILWESEIDNGNIIHKETYKKKKDCFMGVSNKDTDTDSE